MAIFGIGKKAKKEELPKVEHPTPPVTASTSVSTHGVAHASLAHVLKHQRITEKASVLQERGVYVFDVASESNKRMVYAAVRQIYKVTPTKVRMVRIAKKIRKNMRTGQIGVTSGGKKAYVYVKKGDTINLV